MKLSLGGTALTTGGYQAITAGSNAAITAGASGVIEIEGSNIANFADTANGGAVELAMIAAVNAIANGSYTVTLYGSGNAAVYTVTQGSGAGTMAGAADIVVEHLITLIGVTSGSLTSLNFYS